MRQTALWALLVACALVGGCYTRYADLPMSPTQTIAQSEDALRRGEYETAAQGFSDYIASGQKTFRARAFFELAQAQYGLENYGAALDTLGDLEEQFPNETGPQTPALRGDIDYALGKRPEAIRQWDLAWQRGDDSDRQFLRPRIEHAIDELTPLQASELAAELPNDDVRAMLAVRVPGARPARGAVAAGAPAGHHTGAAPENVAPEGEAGAQPAIVLDTPPQPNLSIDAGDALDPGARVACLLPLSGPDRAYGQRALTGLRLAFTGFSSMMMVRDTSDQPELAAQLANALADDPNVVAFIGPSRGDTASVVAPLAERLQMPTLLLAHDQGLTGAYVLQTATTQQEQVVALVDHTVHTLGLTKLGVLYPDNDYGRSYMTTFRDEANRAGAALVKSSAYRPDPSSVAPLAATVKGWASTDGVQAIFIPDSAPTAVKIAAAARGVAPQIQLLGTESWNQPDVLASAGSGIDGAIFADSFFIGSGTPSTADFVTRFRAQNGHDPSGIEAQAYDAGMLVREAIAQGARTRGAVLQFLRGVTDYQGAGTIASGASGLSPDLVLLQVHDGRVATVSR